jgi:hypothetical protein
MNTSGFWKNYGERLSLLVMRFATLHPLVSPYQTLLKPAQWNQIFRLNRLSPAIPVTQSGKNHNYRSAAIPPGRSDPEILP